MKNLIKIFLILTITSCGYLNQLKPDENLQENVENELQEKSSVNFDNITDFEWDNLLILGPYSQVEIVEDSLNLNLSNIRQNEIKHTDFYSLIVFLKDRKSVNIIELNRAFNYPNTKLIPRNKSYFEIDNDGILVSKN
ncbi:hypothetical protein E0K83_16030 [Gramella sp. BOM4]|nr:hypothetical protein [Christiangramia bathymodioli]